MGKYERRTWASGSGAPCVTTRTRRAAVRHGGRARHGRRRLSTGATAQVRGNVRRALAVEAVGRVLGVVQVQTTHVELFSHGDGLFGEA
jgi:hypothetical protein